MDALLLVSGKSSRVAPISDKSLLPFQGCPLFIHLLKNALEGGVKKCTVVTNEANNSAIQKVLKTYQFNAQTVLQKDLSTGQAGGVLSGLQKISKDSPILVLSGNDWISSEGIQNLLKDGKKHDGAILSRKVSHYFPGGYLKLRNDGTISEIIEKPTPGTEPSSYIHLSDEPNDALCTII